MYIIIGKTSLILSLIGLIRGIIVPGTIDHTYWGEQINSKMDWFFFIIFVIISLIGMILGYYSKKKIDLAIMR